MTFLLVLQEVNEIRFFVYQVARTSFVDPGCFLKDPGSGSDHFLIPDPDPNTLIPDPT
jgi:hypothetical protein